jgi:hypothetical protein
MNKLIIASLRENAGKTSLIVGLAKASKKKIGYMKPFGDRLLYRKKRVWDYDAALMASLFDLEDSPENMTLGLDHAKLRFMYDEAGTKDRLRQALDIVSRDRDVVLIEGGRDLTYGASVHLDAISIAETLHVPLAVVVSGDEGTVLDDVTFLKKWVNLRNVVLAGVIVNKVHDVNDFKATCLDAVVQMGVDVLGVVPHRAFLAYHTIDHIAERLFAKVVAGVGGLHRVVKNILVGAMSADAVLREGLFTREDKLVITSGDRSDMILAALETNAVGIVLTNNILPPSNIISLAADRNVPLLLVSTDTYQTAKRVDDMQPLLTKDSVEKIALLEELVGANLTISY